jgi:hypothetical protein
MKKDGFATSFMVDRSPEEVFNAINTVRGWWSGTLPNHFNGIAIEKLIPPGVIKEHRHQVPYLGARASRSCQTAEP